MSNENGSLTQKRSPFSISSSSFRSLPIVSSFPRITHEYPIKPVINAEFRSSRFYPILYKKGKKKKKKERNAARKNFSLSSSSGRRANPVLSRQARQHRSIRLWDPTDVERGKGKDVGSSRNLELEHLETGGWRMHLLAETIPFLFHISGTVLKKCCDEKKYRKE